MSLALSSLCETGALTFKKNYNYAKISKSCCFKSKKKENFRSYQRLFWCKKECMDSSKKHLGKGFDLRIP